MSLEAHEEVLQLNAARLFQVCHHFGLAMRARQKGGIILLSSMVAFQGAARLGHYAATKGYALLLGEALYQELKPLGVAVLTLCLGATATPAYRQAAGLGKELLPVLDPDWTAKKSLRQLGKRAVYIPGLWNQWVHWFLQRFWSRTARRRLIDQQAKIQLKASS
ncbi:MAG: SDR family NAD(P)-dependent oxidoreductase [Microscillaceae bacterium]|nr:SDR family NAD(P)-dependent oxidoreductase [Microscillaceae bacterium]